MSPRWGGRTDRESNRERYRYGEHRTLKVVPVRNNGRGWIFTDEHRAQAWALVAFQRGHPAKIVLRKATKRDAEALLDAAKRAMEGPARGYRLGSRMGKKEKTNA